MDIAAESVRVLKMQLRHKYVKAVGDVRDILSKFATMFKEGKVWLVVSFPKVICEKSLNEIVI